MDNFTLAVIISDVAMCVAFAVLIIIDKGRPAPAGEPPKPAGKRPA